MDKRNGDAVFIAPNDVVKVTTMNHVIEVQHMEKMNRKNNIKKLDKDRFVDLSTGEIREFEHSENRQENYNSLRQTFKKLRYLINNNFIGRPNELHITLTYKKNMTDTKKLYSDFQNFIDRLRYKYKKESSIDYLSVVEPQGRGAWHCHVLMRFNDLDKIYIKNAELRSLWGLGFVTIKSLKDIDNIGAYLSAYLTDIDLEDVQDRETALKVASEGCEVQTKIVEGREKKFLKGGRLHMYPSGMNMYRKSKGIVKPEREEMKFGDIKKVVGSANPHYEKSYHVENDNFENTISFLQYNTKRDF
ncbi:hypothetical protein ACFC4C_40850 [Streptomyces sp. NPDC056039]|uniref:rolling circle replication-associated protein n=1 Tax=Streptomyces sp. NPDC056039 TaxID=3345687 RepID=UPI0035E03BEE